MVDIEADRKVSRFGFTWYIHFQDAAPEKGKLEEDELEQADLSTTAVLEAHGLSQLSHLILPGSDEWTEGMEGFVSWIWKLFGAQQKLLIPMFSRFGKHLLGWKSAKNIERDMRYIFQYNI